MDGAVAGPSGKWNLGVKAVSSRVLAVALAALLTAGGGAAWAHWSTAGSGTASATARTFETVAVVATGAGDAPDSTLVPGGTADVILRVRNPNDFAATVYSVAPSGPVTADAGHPGCTATGVSFTATSAPLTPAVELPPGETLIHLQEAAAMDATSQSACQGATFSIPVTLTAIR